MKELIKTINDFKIIPQNFQSSSNFELLEVDENSFKIKLNLSDINEINDYEINSLVEVFGVNNIGLIYFGTKIIDKQSDILTLALVQDYSVIQRREYSRVGFENGCVQFLDLETDFIHNIEDISAGGIKFIANYPMDIEKTYALKIKLSTNMEINCNFQPIRIYKDIIENSEKYLISGKFNNLDNIDRISLVQYTFKIKMEKQNQNGNITEK